MKGLGILQWTFITLALLLVIAIFAFNQLAGILSDADRMRAIYEAGQASSVINAIQSMPSGSEHVHGLQRCIELGRSLSASTKDFEYEAELIITEVGLPEGEVCNEVLFKKSIKEITAEETGG